MVKLNINLMKNLKIDLEKKYLYLPMISKFDNKAKNIFEMIKRVDKKSLLEEVDAHDSVIASKKKELRQIKVKIMKDLILNNKQIPEKWIFKRDYEDILDEAMSDPIVLQYAIINSDIYKKRAYPEMESNSYKKRNISISKSVGLPRNKYISQTPHIKTYNSPLLFSRRNIDTHHIRSDSNISQNLNHNVNDTKKEKFLLTAIEEKKEFVLPKIVAV